jgi:Peptidase family M1 domain
MRRLVAPSVLGIVLLLSGWAPGIPAAAAAPAVPRPRYGLAVRVDYDAARAEATEDVRFTNVYGVPLQTIVFHTMAGAFGALQLGAVQVNGQDVAPSFDDSGSVFELPLPDALGPDAAADVRLDWVLQVPRTPGRLSASGEVLALGNWYPTLAVHHGDWDRRPYQEIGDAFFTESADYDVRLDLSRPATVAYTGDLVQQTGTHWELSARGVRDFSMALSPGYNRLDGTVDGGPSVSVYTLNAGQGQAFLDAAREYAAAYQSLVGPYPYQTLRVAETGLPSQWSGMEYPELVFISTGVAPHGPAAIRSVVAHEVAHQWFYGLLGDDELADPWLDEAFATYLPLEAAESLPADQAAASTLAPPGPGPAIDQSIESFSSDGAYAAAVYARGGRFLAELRQAMGDGAWTSFLRALYRIYVDKVESPGAVLDQAQQAAPDTNLNPLIAEYTRNTGFRQPRPARWTLDAPSSPWTGPVTVDVEAEFPLTAVELWLDDRLVATGSAAGRLSVDASAVPAGEYVLLARVSDDQGAVHERAVRVSLAA